MVTAKRNFPVGVEVEYKMKEYMFRVIFTESSGQRFETEWLWNIGCCNEKNQKEIDDKLTSVEKYIDQELQRNIELSLMESRREQMIEAKVHRLMDKMW